MANNENIRLTGSLPSFAKEFVVADKDILSAVIFGSMAKGGCSPEVGNRVGSDIDFHIIVRDKDWAKGVRWSELMGSKGRSRYWVHSFRPVAGGVQKWTVIYETCQLDLVVIPLRIAQLARLSITLGLHSKVKKLRFALNEMASCLCGGYFFVKGEKYWGKFYASVSLLPGVRLSDAEIEDMANRVVCDCIWIMQKLEGGEIVAAQRALHTKVVETNILLWREMRLRKSLPLLAFGPGRKIELYSDQFAVPAAISISCLATREGIATATASMLMGLQDLVGLMKLSWVVPQSVSCLFNKILPLQSPLRRE